VRLPFSVLEHHLAFVATTPSIVVFSLTNTSPPPDYFDFKRTSQDSHHLPQYTSPMGNTEAKLSALPEQAEYSANYSTLKRPASPPALDTSNKRRATALEVNDTGHTHDIPTSSSESNKLHEGLRDSLDDDERFLEQPQIFDLVGVVAKKYGLDDELLHKNYRGQDAISFLQNRTGKWKIHMSKVRSFRPVTAVAKSVHIGDGQKHKQETFVLGRKNEDDSQWLTASFCHDTQLPHLVLRISLPSTGDAHGKREYVFVNIFATNLARSSKSSIQMITGKGVAIGHKLSKQLADAQPRLLEKVEEGLVTMTSIKLNRVDKGMTDVDGRSNRPIIVGNVSRTELDKMAAEVHDGKPDQPAHEQLLGLIHGDMIREKLILYSECDDKDTTRGYAREANLCRLFSLTMVLCNELGNFWAYRLQFPDISWTDEDFPFKDLLPPRWTVRKWLARSDKVADGQAVAAAVPAQWQAINRPRVLPGAEEEKFLRGLDAVEDDPISMRALVRKDFTPDSDGQTFIPRSV